MGRRTKLTEERIEKIIRFIKIGTPIKEACIAVGISEQTYYNWKNRGETAKSGKYLEFFESIKKAECESIVRDLTNIEKKAQEDWKASAWRLERRHPQLFGKREHVDADVRLSGHDVLRKLVQSDEEDESEGTD